MTFSRSQRGHFKFKIVFKTHHRLKEASGRRFAEALYTKVSFFIVRVSPTNLVIFFSPRYTLARVNSLDFEFLILKFEFAF